MSPANLVGRAACPCSYWYILTPRETRAPCAADYRVLHRPADIQSLTGLQRPARRCMDASRWGVQVHHLSGDSHGGHHLRPSPRRRAGTVGAVRMHVRMCDRRCDRCGVACMRVPARASAAPRVVGRAVREKAQGRQRLTGGSGSREAAAEGRQRPKGGSGVECCRAPWREGRRGAGGPRGGGGRRRRRPTGGVRRRPKGNGGRGRRHRIPVQGPRGAAADGGRHRTPVQGGGRGPTPHARRALRAAPHAPAQAPCVARPCAS